MKKKITLLLMPFLCLIFTQVVLGQKTYSSSPLNAEFITTDYDNFWEHQFLGAIAASTQSAGSNLSKLAFSTKLIQGKLFQYGKTYLPCKYTSNEVEERVVRRLLQVISLLLNY